MFDLFVLWLGAWVLSVLVTALVVACVLKFSVAAASAVAILKWVLTPLDRWLNRPVGK